MLPKSLGLARISPVGRGSVDRLPYSSRRSIFRGAREVPAARGFDEHHVLDADGTPPG